MVRPHAKAVHGLRFGDLAKTYDRVRPDYPSDALDLIGRSWHGLRVCDLGAGTGILSRELLARGSHVIAVDPDASSLELNPVASCIGSAESTGLESASVDVVTVAQAWHWFAEAEAGEEIARILTPGGSLLILINQLDVRIDWVLRLSRIMHAGDVYRPAYRPQPGSGLKLRDHALVEFTTPVDVDLIIDLARTRSYWLRSDVRIRDRVEGNLRGFLSDEHPIDGRVALPYMCLAYLFEASGP